jgi:hypothetical protein
MDALTPVGGLNATASALRTAQRRFETATEDVTAAATPPAEAAVPSTSLVDATAGLAEERFVNQVLMGVFKAQDRQQQDLLRIRS